MMLNVRKSFCQVRINNVSPIIRQRLNTVADGLNFNQHGVFTKSFSEVVSKLL